MKVDTVDQYKIMEFLKENFELELFNIELVNRNTIKITDTNKDSMEFKYENNKIIY